MGWVTRMTAHLLHDLGEVAISQDVIEYLKARLDSAKAELHDLGVEDAEGSDEDV